LRWSWSKVGGELKVNLEKVEEADVVLVTDLERQTVVKVVNVYMNLMNLF